MTGDLEAAAVESVAFRLDRLEAEVAKIGREWRGSRRRLTIIAFSGDMDKLQGAFTVANGAAALGVSVSMFFAFWALAALKRQKIYRGKSFLDKAMTAVLPGGAGRLGVSRMNLGGLGRRLFAVLMRRHRVEPLEGLIVLAKELNVRIVACEASMEIMGVAQEELLEGVEVGGLCEALDAGLDSAAMLWI